LGRRYLSVVPSARTISRNFTPLSANAHIAGFAERHIHHEPHAVRIASRTHAAHGCPSRPATSTQRRRAGRNANPVLRAAGSDAALLAHKAAQRDRATGSNAAAKTCGRVQPLVQQPSKNLPERFRARSAMATSGTVTGGAATDAGPGIAETLSDETRIARACAIREIR
jgi:hypothetical protein